MASSAIITPAAQAAVRPKANGETKVVYLGGDQLHNFVEQENTIRGICIKAGWRILSTYDNFSVTPELLSDTDLFIYTRWEGFVGGWHCNPLLDSAEPVPNDKYSYSDLIETIMDNVIKRGMGFMSLHCTIAHFSDTKFCEFMGIKPMMHGPVQTVRCHNFNQNHPITKGIPDFDLALDENFGVELINKNAVPLYESTGYDDKRHDIAGWCFENGKGRIVGLAAGHTNTSWRHPLYQKLYWGGAHWAMRKEIPPYKS
jgi:type 1 glutamine amidotransferase